MTNKTIVAAGSTSSIRLASIQKLAQKQIYALADSDGFRENRAIRKILYEKQPSSMFVRQRPIDQAFVFLCNQSASEIRELLM